MLLPLESLSAPVTQSGPDKLTLYLIIGAAAALVLAVLVMLTVRRVGHDEAHSLRRAARLLKRFGGKGSVSYIKKDLRTEEGDEHFYELINVAADRVYIAKVYAFGRKVLGNSKEDSWRFTCGKDVREEKNPLPELERGRVVLTRHFIKSHLRNIPVQTLVIFADRTGSTRCTLPGVSNVTDCNHMRRFRKTYRLNRTPIDQKAVCEALESGFIQR